jgi:hypothetical protein
VYRVEHDPHDRSPAFYQCDRDSIVGQLMDIIGRTIQRVDYPAVFGCGIELGCGLLAEERMAGKGTQDDVADDFLCGCIGLSDEVCGAFFAHSKSPNPAQQLLAAGPRCLLANC